MFIVTEEEIPTKGVYTLGDEVTRREHRLSDFKSTAIWFLFLIPSAFLIFSQPVANVHLHAESPETYGQLGIVLAVIFGIITFCSFINSWSKPRMEQQNIAAKLCLMWEEKTLIPYLERKHGVKFANKHLNKWGYNRVTKDARTFEVSVSGLHLSLDENYGDDGNRVWKYEVFDSEGPWLEEVVRPGSISYKALPTVG